MASSESLLFCPAVFSRLLRLVLLVGSLVTTGGAVLAQDFRPIPRQVLVITEAGADFQDNDIQLMLAMPLYHLGLRPYFLDPSQEPLPSDAEMELYRGILLYTHVVDCKPDLRRWLVDQRAAGRKLVLLSTLAEDPEEVPSPCAEDDEDVNELYEPLDLTYSSVLTAKGAEDLVEVLDAEDGLFGFEKELSDIARLPYVFMRATGSSESLLEVWMRDIENSETDLVVTGPWGGYAVTEYLWVQTEEKDFAYWVVDPLAFLERAFDWEGMPRVEANVLNGRRVFFAHIDGDGFNSYAYDVPSKICGELIYDQILLEPKYQHLPQTISLISAEVDTATTHPVEASIPTARRVFDLENVEAASHAFSHPMEWPEGTLAFNDIVLDGVPYRFDSHKETVGSLEFLSQFAPPERPARVMLWSGSCNPEEYTLRGLREAGMYNMNGGDPRLDEEYDSWSQVAPPVWQVGKEFRFSSGAANEYLMTNEWAPPFTGFRNIVETFRNTERPRPLTPVDVYYHFYIAERDHAFETLKTVLDWCLRHDLAHLFVSEYLDGMIDLLDTRLSRDGDWYRVENEGKLPSIRFDGESRHVDLTSSQGVLGYRHRWGSLYVFLDGSKDHRFRLTDEEQTVLRVLESSRPLTLLPRKQEGELLAFRSQGPGEAVYRFGGLEPGEYVSVERIGGPASAYRDPILQVDARGALEIRARCGQGAEVRVTSSSETAYRLHQWNIWFADEGRYILLCLALTGLSWGLCRFHRPRIEVREASDLVLPGLSDDEEESARGAEEDVDASGVGLVVEAGTMDGAPSFEDSMPAGGVGPWSDEMMAALRARARDEEDPT